MFNFGFLEFLVLAIIAFLVLGPEEFPKFTRKLLRMINGFKATVTDIKTELKDIEEETKESFSKITEDIEGGLETSKEVLSTVRETDKKSEVVSQDSPKGEDNE